MKTKLGILASGRGSNLGAIIKACNNRTLNAVVEIVISNNPDSGALKIAKQENLEHRCLRPSDYPDADALDRALTETLVAAKIDLVILAGYMKKIGPLTLHRFDHKIINIHPSLLPKFGGKGMYGLKVHQAVIDAGESETGATVHLVDAEYDQGRILEQKKVEIGDNHRDAQTLAARVLEIEHKLYPETINKFIEEQNRENHAHHVARRGS